MKIKFNIKLHPNRCASCQYLVPFKNSAEVASSMKNCIANKIKIDNAFADYSFCTTKYARASRFKLKQLNTSNETKI
jgi:hypothetical protein